MPTNSPCSLPIALYGEKSNQNRSRIGESPALLRRKENESPPRSADARLLESAKNQNSFLYIAGME